MARIQARIDANEAATTGAANATEQLIATLRAKADEAWPTLQQGLKGTTDIDLSKPGQAIRFTADNLMGYRFKPGDFYFATTLPASPSPLASIPPSSPPSRPSRRRSNVPSGTATTMGSGGLRRRDLEGPAPRTTTDRRQGYLIEGLDVRVKGEYADPVDAVVIDIVAAKCGPFAGAKGRGTS